MEAIPYNPNIHITLELEKIKILANVKYQLRKKHDALLIILKFIHELEGHEQNLTLTAIQQKLLPFPTIGIKRLLWRLHEFNLIEFTSKHPERLSDINEDDSFNLTEKGKTAVSEELISLPSEGTLELAFIEHPLFPEIMYSITKIDDTSHQKKKQNNDQELKSHQWKQECPILNNLINRPNLDLLIPFEDGEITLTEISENVFFLSKTKILLEIFLYPDHVDVKLKDNESSKPHNYHLPSFSSISFETVMDYIIENADSWRKYAGKYFLLLPYSNINSREKTLFQKDKLEIPSSSFLEELDLYPIKSLLIHKIPVQPKSADDANLWFRDILPSAIKQYITREEYNQIVKEQLLPKFIFHEFEIDIPKIETLISQIYDHNTKKGTFPPVFWFLAAPQDVIGVEFNE